MFYENAECKKMYNALKGCSGNGSLDLRFHEENGSTGQKGIMATAAWAYVSTKKTVVLGKKVFRRWLRWLRFREGNGITGQKGIPAMAALACVSAGELVSWVKRSHDRVVLTYLHRKAS